jgi:hypothetical protein
MKDWSFPKLFGVCSIVQTGVVVVGALFNINSFVLFYAETVDGLAIGALIVSLVFD